MDPRYRFSRSRHGELRLRVTVFEPDLDDFCRYWPATRVRPVDAPLWRTSIQVGPTRMEGLLGALEATGGTCQLLAQQVRVRHAQLAGKVKPEPGPRLGFDDVDLRALVLDVVPACPCGKQVLMHEFGLTHAGARVDLASMCTHQWVGLELKGTRDSLTRLTSQVAAYSPVFDQCVLLTVPEHVHSGLVKVPAWWQVIVVTGTTMSPELSIVRWGGPNPQASAQARAQLLWRSELWSLLKQERRAAGRSMLRRHELAQAYAQGLDPAVVRTQVWKQISRRVGDAEIYP